MDRHDIDWQVLRGGIAALSVTLVLVAGVVLGGAWFKSGMQTAYEKDQRRFMATSRRYLALDEEERIIREYYPRFQELERAGLIGEEKRLDWTETLRQVSAELKLPSLSYAIAPRDIYQPPVDIQVAGYQPFASSMRLSAGLVHAEDLLRLFEALERRARGLFNVEGCTLTRTATAGGESPERANVNADCDLKWFTLRKPSPEEIGL